MTDRPNLKFLLIATGLALVAGSLILIPGLRRLPPPANEVSGKFSTNGSRPQTREGISPEWREVEELAQKSPKQALELAGQLPASNARDRLMEKITCAWVASEPADAVEWVQSLGASDPSRSLLLSFAIREWAKTAPEPSASLAIDELPDGPPRTALVLELLDAWAQSDFSEAEVWVGNLDEGALKEAAVAKLTELEPTSR